jgi:hypothetical protein
MQALLRAPLGLAPLTNTYQSKQMGYPPALAFPASELVMKRGCTRGISSGGFRFLTINCSSRLCWGSNDLIWGDLFFSPHFDILLYFSFQVDLSIPSRYTRYLPTLHYVSLSSG